MCLAIPAKIVAINGMMATASMMDVKKEISLMMVDNIQVGDYVLVHVGYALQKIDEEEANKTMEILLQLEQDNQPGI